MVGAMRVFLLASVVLSCKCLTQGEMWPRRPVSWAEELLVL